MTNRLLAPLVDEIWYAIAPDRPLGPRERIVGMPVRASMRRPMDVAAARRTLGLVPEKTTIVAMGGSLGAASINDAVAALLEAGVPAGWQFAVIAGARDFEPLRARLAGRPDVVVLPYLDDPRPAFAAADVVLARAGASTLAELAATGTPALLVPYPHATADHQRHNAERYASGGSARVIDDRDLSAERLRSELGAMLAHDALARIRAAASIQAGTDPRAVIVARVKRFVSSNGAPP